MAYFFRPPLSGEPESTYVCNLQPEDSILIGITGPYGLRHGIWKVFATTERFDDKQWPVPVFRVTEDPSGPLETYDDRDLLTPYRVTDKEGNQHRNFKATKSGV
ncbi:MAG: hypothetical protein M3N13_02165, partial [Candidatus Eremiobacteraeota bacterium]|nr:hypothetical protein [Candidatus Eremiobacteraeota bacterium]